MTKTQQVLALLEEFPRTKAGIDHALGYRFSVSQLARMVSKGFIEEFQDANQNSEGKWARLMVRKFKVGKLYISRQRKAGKVYHPATLAGFARVLRVNGYEVTKLGE